MTSHEREDRHLSPDGFRDYLRSGVPSLVKLDGAPVVYLVIEPLLRRVGLRAPAVRHAVPDITAYRHVSASIVHWNDSHWCELRIDGDMTLEAYPILCAIADRIQLRSMDFSAAVVDALSRLGELLAGRGRLSDEQEIGLFGELTVLRHLLRWKSPGDAVASWRGPEGEEHDYVLQDDDIEVKSTTAETRTHWISGMRQLEPTPGRRLRLLSLQLTGAGAGGASLAELIAMLREALPNDATRAAFSRKLELSNWHESAADLYTRRFRLRTDPELYDIDAAFPALTPTLLASAGVDHARIRQVRYLVELDGLPAAAERPSFLLNLGR